MTVRQRVLEARILEKARKNPKLAEEMGIRVKHQTHLDNKTENDDFKLTHKNDQLLK